MKKADLPQCSKTLPPPKGSKVYAVSEPLAGLLNEVANLTDEDRFQLTCELMKTFAKDEIRTKKLRNWARDMTRKQDAVPKEVCGQQRTVYPGASGSLPASHVPFICRGDILAATSVLFFDTEKVSIAQSHEMKSGDLAIVDVKGQLLFWCYIKQDNVCTYNQELTGLTEWKVQNGLKAETVQSLLKLFLPGKEIWGAGTHEDLKSLGFNTARLPYALILEDIQRFYRDSNDKAISLAYLSEHFLGENHQKGPTRQ